MSDAPLLEVRDVDFRYNGKPVLQGCSFDVSRGERLAIIGASGSGKSTILRLILGILRPDAGTLRFEERDLAGLRVEELNAARQKIGMVFQGAALISSLTVEENLALPLKELTDKTAREIGEIVDRKLGLVGMEETKDKLPEELSGGMRKRIGVARALVLEPELVLFDEPSSGLDPVATSEIDELILKLSEETEAACVVVTHNMESAFRIATRMAMLHEGAVLEDGPPEAFRNSKNPIVRRFVAGRTSNDERPA